MLWKDSNENHYTDADELISLASEGIASLKVDYSVHPEKNNGNLLLERSWAFKGDGSRIDMVDAYFAVAQEDNNLAGPSLPSSVSDFV